MSRVVLLALMVSACGARTGLPVPRSEEVDSAVPVDAGRDGETPEPSPLCQVDDLGSLPIDGALVALHVVGSFDLGEAVGFVQTEASSAADPADREASGSISFVVDPCEGVRSVRSGEPTTIALGASRDEARSGWFVSVVDGDAPLVRRLDRSRSVLAERNAPVGTSQVAEAFDDLVVATTDAVLRGRFDGGDWEESSLPAGLREPAIAVAADEGSPRVTIVAVDDRRAWWIVDDVATPVLEQPDLVMVGNTGRAAVVLDRSPAIWIADLFGAERFDLARRPAAVAVAGSEEHDAVVLHVGDELRAFVRGVYVEHFEVALARLVGEVRVGIAGLGRVRGTWPQFVIVWGRAGSTEPLRLASILCPGFAGP